MTAYVYSENFHGFPQYQRICLEGIPLLETVLPQNCTSRRLGRVARRLKREGVRRYFTPQRELSLPGLAAVDPLPVCRAKGAELLLKTLETVPVEKRRVALRGASVTPEIQRIAEKISPQIAALYLDFEKGEDGLRCFLREKFGIAALRLGQGTPPGIAVEFSPCKDSLPKTLCLWGKPELLGWTLGLERELPPGLPGLPFLELLWETGRIKAEEIQIVQETD